MDRQTVEKFGDVMDEFLKSVDIQMRITMSKGMLVEVQDDIGFGPLMQFYILLNAIQPIADSMRKRMGIDGTSEKWAKGVDRLLELVRNELVEGES